MRERLSALLGRISRNKKGASETEAVMEEEKDGIQSFQQLVTRTVVQWAESSHIQDHNLIREMFTLLYRQFDGVGEVSILFL